MSLRLPGTTDLANRSRTGLDILDYEVLGEMATSLGHAGRRVEAAMAELNAFTGTDEARKALVKSTANAVYWYFVQRELCGLKRHDDVIRDHGIPREVLARLGAG